MHALLLPFLVCTGESSLAFSSAGIDLLDLHEYSLRNIIYKLLLIFTEIVFDYLSGDGPTQGNLAMFQLFQPGPLSMFGSMSIGLVHQN